MLNNEKNVHMCLAAICDSLCFTITLIQTKKTNEMYRLANRNKYSFYILIVIVPTLV